MSRVAKNPVSVPAGVEVAIRDGRIDAKGPNGNLSLRVPGPIKVVQAGAELRVEGAEAGHGAVAGTTRALLHNLVTGVSKGFEKRLSIVGVGYRAQIQGKRLTLNLGFSHPVVFEAPPDVSIETPSQTEIVIRGADKQKVGQTAAEIRALRPPEPYKGKGVRYTDEYVMRKQAKKK